MSGAKTPMIGGSTERERIPVTIVPTHEDIARLIADRIVRVIFERVAATGRCVLGLATGSTPLGVYQETGARSTSRTSSPSISTSTTAFPRTAGTAITGS